MSDTFEGNLGHPDAAPAVSILGVARLGDTIFVFIQDALGNIWGRVMASYRWGPWQSVGRPAQSSLLIAKGIIGVTSSRAVFWLFAVGLDGNLWTTLNGSAQWVNLGNPLPAMGKIKSLAGTVVTGDLGAFVIAADGNVWCRAFLGGQWHWASTGFPPLNSFQTPYLLTWETQTGAQGTAGERENVMSLGFSARDGNIYCLVDYTDSRAGSANGTADDFVRMYEALKP